VVSDVVAQTGHSGGHVCARLCGTSRSYAVFAEASTAAWATAYRPPAAAAAAGQDLQQPPPQQPGRAVVGRLDLVVVEIDDAAGVGAAFGTAASDGTHAASLAGARAPHWQKVALLAFMLRGYATVLYVDADATVRTRGGGGQRGHA